MMRSIAFGLVVSGSCRLAFSLEPEPLDLATLLAEAERANPAAAAQSERAAAAVEAAVRGSTLPDPLVSFSYTNDGLSEFTLGESKFSSVTLRWDQEVPRRSVRRLGSEVARREQGAALAAREAGLARLRARVIGNYVAIWRAERLRENVEEARATLLAAREAARARYEAGSGSQESVLRAQTEIRRKDVELVALASERRIAEIDLLDALGRGSDGRFGPAPPLPGLLLPEPGEVDGAAATGPEVFAAQAGADRADAVVAQARASAKPEWGWMAAYQYLRGLDPMVMAGVTVRLPLWSSSKQERLVAETERLAEAARRDTDAAGNASIARARELAEELSSLDRQRTLLEEALIPEGIATLEAARAAFAAGQAEMRLVLDDLALLLDDRQEAAKLAARRVVAAAELEAMIGVPILVLASPEGVR